MYHLLSAARALALCLAITNNLPGRVEAFKLASNHPVEAEEELTVDGIDYNEKANFRPPTFADEETEELDAYRALTSSSSSPSSISYVSFLS